MKCLKKFVSLIATASILMANTVIPTTIYASDNTPDTPLYLFSDTVENHAAGISVTGAAYGTSDVLVDGIWETSETFGGSGKHNTYGIYAESYTKYNKVIGLTPALRAGGELCVLNLAKDLGDASDYIYSVDMKMSDNISGIRLADKSDDSSYYELALVSDESGSKARFSKVTDAVYDTPSFPDDWQYVDYSNTENLTADTWLTLSLAKHDNTLYWSVYNKTTDALLSSGSYTDPSPLFTGLGRLQLFAYGGGETDVLTLFDNIDAKRLGVDIYEDKDGIKFETSWINNSDNQPLIVVADYDEQGRMVSAETFENSVLNNEISNGTPGYFICETPLELSSSNKKLFIWDSKSMKPIYDFVSFTDIESTYTEESRFAVLLENIRPKMTPDGEPVYGATALYNGEETVLYWEDNPALSQGNAIFFTTGENGFVSEEYVVYNKAAASSYTGAGNFEGLADYKSTDWVFGFSTASAADIRLVSGVVTDVTSNSITFGVADSNGDINFANVETDIVGDVSGLFSYGIADDCQAYEYNSLASGRESAKYSLTDASAIIESSLVETYTDVYSVTDPGSIVTNAIALIVNGDVVCIYAIY